MTGTGSMPRGSGVGGDAVRTFICIEIPAEIKAGIAGLQDSLKKTGAHASWVRAPGIHLTLKFLGNVAPPRIQDVSAGVGRAARSIAPFDLVVAGTGCFPSPRSPRVLWVGLASVPEELTRLQAAVEDELKAEGFPREKKRFAPHLTIARLRSQDNVRRLVEQLESLGFEAAPFTAQDVVVMRSDLKPTGPVYTPQASIRLGG